MNNKNTVGYSLSRNCQQDWFRLFKRQLYQKRKYTQVCLSLYDGLSQMVHFSFQYCMAYNVFIRTSDCLHCRQKGLQTGVRDSGPKSCTNQNCAVKERNKHSRKQQALGHTSRLTKWNWRRLRFKCDVTRAETRFRISVKRTSPFKLEGGGVS